MATDSIFFSLPTYRPSVEQILEHPLFWVDHAKIDFLCKVSERIPNIANRDPSSVKFLVDFKSVMDKELPGGQWCHQLPPRRSWGRNQKMPLQAFNVNEGSTLGLIRFVRNIWTHRVQNIRDGSFVSEDDISQIVLGSFPWIVTKVYRLCKKHFSSDLKDWLQAVVRH